jgi:hypothetical protein
MTRSELSLAREARRSIAVMVRHLSGNPHDKPGLDPSPTKGSKASVAWAGRESLVILEILHPVARGMNRKRNLV